MKVVYYGYREWSFKIFNKLKITNKYFESSKTNGWESNAILLSEITIDTTSYIIAENKIAFGIKVLHHGMSRPNPYSNKTISLFLKSEDTCNQLCL